jgi:type II restriction enzyme
LSTHFQKKTFSTASLERNRRATPTVEQARALKFVASRAKTPAELLKIEDIQPAILTAAGVSDKATAHLMPEDKAEAVKGLIENFLEPAGADFVEELVFRFLLTRGDTLGGSMRNIGGTMAQRKLTRAIITALSLSGTPYQWLHSNSKSWIPMANEDADIELYLHGLTWMAHGRELTLIYNQTSPIVKNNIDLCILDCPPDKLSEAIQSPERYIALGELKGGIDPAGADEHWKTARTSLSRIRKSFAAKGLSPHIFFVGAAVAKKMANEIWNQLETNALSNAANLTNSNQVSSLCIWLCNL